MDTQQDIDMLAADLCADPYRLSGWVTAVEAQGAGGRELVLMAALLARYDLPSAYRIPSRLRRLVREKTVDILRSTPQLDAAQLPLEL